MRDGIAPFELEMKELHRIGSSLVDGAHENNVYRANT